MLDGADGRPDPGKPWTESGLGCVFQKAKPESWASVPHLTARLMANMEPRVRPDG